MHKIIDNERSMGRGPAGHRSAGITKKLTLQRETLRELTVLDLQHVEGGVEGDPGPTSNNDI